MLDKRKSVPFCGRTHDIAAITAKLVALQEGRPQTVLVHGEPGIGKSRLIDEALERTPGLRVLSAKVEEIESARPFGVLVDALDAHTSSSDPPLAAFAEALIEGAAEYEMIELAAAALEYLALQGPVVCVLDDLQWADPSSVRALGFAARHVSDLPLGVVATFRPVPSHPVLSQWVADSLAAGALEIALEPLDAGAVAQLVEHVAGKPPGGALTDMMRGTAGNPFYVIELLESLQAEGALHSVGSVVDVGRTNVSAQFRSAIFRYLTFVSPPSLDLLRSAAVLGVSFSVTDLAAFTARPAHEVVAVAEEARHAGILAEAGDRLRFRHDLLREALYFDLPESARRALHLDVARALARSGAAASQVAEHLLIGGPERDPEAVRYLLDAAKAATDLGIRATLLLRVLDILGASDERRRDVAAGAVHALGASGRLPEAEELVQREQAMDPRAELTLRMALVRAYSDHLMHVPGLREIDRLERDKGLTPIIRAELLARRGAMLLMAGDPAASEIACIEALSIAGVDDPLPAIIALQTLSLIRGFAGRPHEAMASSEEATRAEVPTTPTASHVFGVMVLIGEDRFDEADEIWRIGYERCRAMAFLPPQGHYLFFRSLRMLLAGRLDDAVADSEASFAIFDDLGGQQGVLFARAVLARVSLHRGDVAAARARLDMGGPPPPELGADWYLWAAAMTEVADGHPELGFGILSTAWDATATMRYFLGAQATFGPDLVRLALAHGERDRATAVAAEVAAGAAASDAPSAEGAALLCQGLVDADASLLAKALAAYELGPRPLQTARAREDLAGLLTTDGDGADQLRLALAEYDRLGAIADAARVTAALRAQGLRFGARGRRDRPAVGWEALTPAEEQVVALAVAGFLVRDIAKQLYISPHTVETHLRHVYRKLGLASRVELAAAAASRHG